MSTNLPAPGRIRTGGLNPDQLFHLGSAVAGSFALTWMLFERILPVTSPLGFAVSWYALFLTMYAVISATTLDRVGVVDRVVGALVATAGAVLVAVLAGIVVFITIRGKGALAHTNFYTDTLALVGPDDGLTKGGIYSAMIGTFEQVALAILISVPVGIATAVYLNEVGGRLARTVRTVVHAMSAIPTIVAGLFIYAMFIIGFDLPHWLPLLGDRVSLPRSGFAASLALSVSMIPVVITTAEVVLRLVPNGLREASLALGTSRWQTVKGVVLPTARPGLITAVLLGIARVIGETSPVLLVAGYTNALNYDPFHGPQVSLPLFVFNLARQPFDVAIARAFGAAVVLLVLVVIFFATARILGGRAPGQVSARKQRRLSARLARRQLVEGNLL
ncbi:phosphate ABC transporter permease PstA [Nocardioides marmorisolisilvae]|uniref:Phosphate transport system permease protein PstA n=1 Tax=Nocardioides marmorisolisilvae TaxID=1542737 RepID=A0A3N0DSB8_9ACTN|nr:phosphate ABC transporter permease PstA [Nocardioides marmorisolisilvae]RNL78411.1 phosphate ABC transporter permease PstA [Nocardioides marmorisolisilvae]